MKKDNIMHDVKTATIVAGLALTLNSCGNKPLTTEQRIVAEQRADSASNKDRNYTIAKRTAEFGEYKINKYHNENKKLVKQYALVYISREIKDAQLYKFMTNAIETETVSQYTEDFVENGDSIVNDSSFGSVDMKNIRRNQRWFNDLMLYLSGKYDDRQLLNSTFFNTVKNQSLKIAFQQNVYAIENLKNIQNFALQRKNAIYDENLRKYEEEIKRQR